MTTTFYLRYGRTYPLHLLGDDDLAVCGALRRGGDGVNLLAVAPRPLGDWCTCEACRVGVDASHSATGRAPVVSSLSKNSVDQCVPILTEAYVGK